jgi:hypothetical protein
MKEIYNDYKHKSAKLARRLSKKGLTTDLQDYLPAESAAFIGLLTDISKFADKYDLKERAVVRHLLLGDIPCVFIDGHVFVLDLGHEEFARSLGWELDIDQLETIEKLLVERLGGIKSAPRHLRRKKSGHRRREMEPSWRKGEAASFADFMKIGYA